MSKPTTEDLVDETVEPEFYLTAIDRCDSCQAQAYYLVSFSSR